MGQPLPARQGGALLDPDYRTDTLTSRPAYVQNDRWLIRRARADGSNRGDLKVYLRHPGDQSRRIAGVCDRRVGARGRNAQGTTIGSTGVPPAAAGIAPSTPAGVVWPTPDTNIATVSPMCAGLLGLFNVPSWFRIAAVPERSPGSRKSPAPTAAPPAQLRST